MALPIAAPPQPGEVLAVAMGDRRLAVWGTSDGGVQAWDDRCPHRGAPLSAGRVRDGQLVCGKHGWRFDACGHRIVPREADRAVSALDACARVHETRREGTAVWVRMTADQPGEVIECR
jgi:phenylpropionate dioxygenase-like ring-hydroxylating dioxygenase large terminal subunit